MKTRQISEFKDTEIGKIPNDWEVAPLGDFISHLGDYHSNGSYKKLKDNVTLLSKENFAIMIRTTNFEQDDFSDNLRYVDKNAYDFLAKSKVEPYDIIMNKIANAGSTYLMPKLEKPVSLGMNLFLIRIKDLDQKYVYYFLKDRENYVKSFAQGSVTKTITKDNVRKLQIAFPKSIEEQKSIVKILSDLNSEIVNIQNQNKILEQIAQAIFKSWFVDFDGETEFHNSELGSIPKEWRVGKLKDFSDIKSGFAFKSGDYVEKGIFLLRTTNFSKTEYVVKEDVIYLPSDFYEKFKNFQLNKFDILLIMVGASIGSLGFVTSNILPALQNQNMWNIRSKKDHQQLFLKHLIKKIVSDHIGTRTGSARDFFRKDYFRNIKFIEPPDRLIWNFNHLITPVYEKLNDNIEEIDILKNLRDFLLPKLMSGEIRV